MGALLQNKFESSFLSHFNISLQALMQTAFDSNAPDEKIIGIEIKRNALTKCGI